MNHIPGYLNMIPIILLPQRVQLPRNSRCPPDSTLVASFLDEIQQSGKQSNTVIKYFYTNTEHDKEAVVGLSELR